MNRFSLLAALVACLVTFMLMLRLNTLEQELDALKHHAPAASGVAPAAAPVPQLEVAVYMGRIQVFANKLWSAGKANNVPLADFYRHEMKEAMEDLVAAHITDDGVDVSAKMALYGISTLDALKAEMKQNGLKDFDGQYATLVNTCNTCHTECGKPFLRVKVPTFTRYDDQEFAPAR